MFVTAGGLPGSRVVRVSVVRERNVAVPSPRIWAMESGPMQTAVRGSTPMPRGSRWRASRVWAGLTGRRAGRARSAKWGSKRTPGRRWRKREGGAGCRVDGDSAEEDDGAAAAFLDHPAEDLIGPGALAGVAAAFGADVALGGGEGGEEEEGEEGEARHGGQCTMRNPRDSLED